MFLTAVGRHHPYQMPKAALEAVQASAKATCVEKNACVAKTGLAQALGTASAVLASAALLFVQSEIASEAVDLLVAASVFVLIAAVVIGSSGVVNNHHGVAANRFCAVALTCAAWVVNATHCRAWVVFRWACADEGRR